MKLVKFASVSVLILTVIILSGCDEDRIKSLESMNRSQQERIHELEGDINTDKLKLEKCESMVSMLESQNANELGLRDEVVAALQKDIADKTELIEKMQHELLRGTTVLPLELSTMLVDFANNNDMVTFDEERGMLKFKSDLLFASGSDKVTTEAIAPIKQLCSILNSTEGKELDVVIVGHTDNVPISASRRDHPSNWHLSVHRAISVLNEMINQRVATDRMSVKGYGEFRPVVENVPGKGAAENRRVEILLVPRTSN